MISAKLRTVVKDQMVDQEERFLFLNVHIKGEPFTLASLYAPNERLYTFLDKCLTFLQSFGCGPLIVGGDLNSLMDAKLDYSGPKNVKNPAWCLESGFLRDTSCMTFGKCITLQKRTIHFTCIAITPIRD